MYKSMLQELCQKKSWTLPVYETVKDGPDHKPVFTATVTVNNSVFESLEQCWSSKEAQNVAARVAFHHFSPSSTGGQEHAISVSSASAINSDTKAAKRGKMEQNGNSLDGLLHTFKNRLQIYAQKHNLVLPAYSGEIVGPPHDRRYKSKVTVDGKSFETPDFFSTLKDAEHGAAKVAFESMSLHLTEEDEVLYKSLLQEYAQKGGLPFPTYATVRSGQSHLPIFVSTVEIGGKFYQGQEGKTKKMAETNAAKAAYICLTCQETQSPNFSVGENSDASSFSLQPDVTGIVEEYVAQETQGTNSKRQRNSTSEDGDGRERDPSAAKSPPQDPIIIPPGQTSVRKLAVYPRAPEMIIPEGATIYPSSDDQWVGVVMTLREEEYEGYNN
ncbi:hypothetical protein AgCh_012994 [Apium graveolens]